MVYIQEYNNIVYKQEYNDIVLVLINNGRQLCVDGKACFLGER